LKILHFAPDQKFIRLQQDLFEEAFPISNSWRIQGDSEKPFQYEILAHNTRRVPRAYYYSEELKKESEDFDLLIVHSMTAEHATGVKTVNPKICIFWIGFGHDYYHLMERQLGPLLLDRTLQLDQMISKKDRWLRLLSPWRVTNAFKGRIQSLLSQNNFVQGDPLIEVADRIDVYRISEAEVEMLQKVLPLFRADFHVHHYYTTEDVFDKGPKEMAGPDVLLGNSATATNNHIEAMELLKKAKITGRNIMVPLNYGSPLYAKEICKIGHKLFGNLFNPLKKWLPIGEYNQAIENCGFVVMNHRRIQAFGNINAAIYKGAKLFIRPENPLYKFYLSMGIKIFSIDELAEKGLNALTPVDNRVRGKNRAIIGEYMSRKNTIAHIRGLEKFVIKKRTGQCGQD